MVVGIVVLIKASERNSTRPFVLRPFASNVSGVDESPTLELVTHGVAKGGEAVAREPDGRVVFVEGALPDERVMVEISESKKGFLRGRATEILEPSPHRIDPSCAEVANGCGGCDFQIASPEHQLELKRVIVTDALERIGKLEQIPDIETVPLPASGYRTAVRCVVSDGQAGYRARRSHEPINIDSCYVAHPLANELIQTGYYGTASEISIRVGAATGERLVVADSSSLGAQVPSDVVVVGEDELKAGRRAWMHEIVANQKWRISAGSFFQTRQDGAQALVDEVREAVGELPPDARAFDLYGGVGLFAGTVFGPDHHVVLVEQNASSVADAKVNLEGRNVKLVRSKVEGWSPKRADVVIADPARQGLGRNAVSRIAATDAAVVVLVSCDAASLARDASLLARKGYHLDSVTLVDLFPMTSHTETVSRFSVQM